MAQVPLSSMDPALGEGCYISFQSACALRFRRGGACIAVKVMGSFDSNPKFC